MRNVVRSFLFVAAPIAVLGAACASSPRVANDGCELSAADSVHMAGGAVYRSCGVDQPARLAQDARVEFRPAGTPRSECFTAEVEFVVGPSGRPETATARVVRASDPAFGDAVLASVPGWRYTAATVDGVAVRQIVRERRTQAVRVVTTVVTGSGAGGPPPTPPPSSRGPACR
jgi:hypothetical protein